MLYVRWATLALLVGALPACAHTSEGARGPASPIEARADAAESDSASRAERTPRGRRTRFIYLANQARPTEQSMRSAPLVAELPQCDPWARTRSERCDLSEIVRRSLP